MVEVSGYYCPNCLFEVPSASVRAEKNRCARNCFLCPNCRNTLSVVPSDPPETADMRLSAIPINAVGEAPFFLYCNHCRWDSAEVGITFEKPTGLAAQLQRFEDSAPEFLEFERLKEHFEPFLRASSSSPALSTVHSHHIHMNPITAAASSALARDVPGVGKYTPLSRSRVGRERSTGKDDISEYKSRVEIGSVSGLGAAGEPDVEFVKHLENMEEVAELEQRWMNSWANSTQASDLKPLRIPLLSKKTKRCPSCRHILIKPEQKAQSVRYKIKLVAANYLPDITVALPKVPGSESARRASNLKSSVTATEPDKGPDGMIAGQTYPFHLAFTNPLYDLIQVRLSVQRQQTPADRRPPFAVSLPTSTFPVAAFAEAWEYEDDEDMFGVEDEEMDDMDVRGGRNPEAKSKTKTVGVLEKRANVTVIGGEVVISKEATGDVKFNMLVSYTYRSDDPVGEENEGTPSRSAGKPEMKTFSFSTVVDLGPVIPREETRTEFDI
ncbi:dynactin p62 [Neolentinus lepideus HHB14362 ss-1]|uniref:Dynactin subunit 4 n=1 Tax=Neolentinus lepideus HHB14362 ss-1 TaxID=1314782 RepID=A0A165UMC1_9AGAM|nr:dynactin p62 [Neolentinus lepideus HHB14362 ss-1]